MRLFALIVVFIALTSAALAAQVNGLTVTEFGAPICYKPNPIPNVTNGTFRPRLPDLDGNIYGSVDPWGEWPLARFRGATYSALFGSQDAPSLAVYQFGVPQTGITLVWGSPHWYDQIAFKRFGAVVAVLWGYDVASAFGSVNSPAVGLNLSITLPHGLNFDKVVFISEGAAFEYANLNAGKCQ